MRKKKLVCLMLAVMMALTLCAGAAGACFQPETAAAIAVEGVNPLYCHGHGGHHGGHGHGHHGGTKSCDWLFHACGDCKDVYCTDEDHNHRCPVDCTNKYHRHYGVCQYADGTLALVKKKA